MALMRFAAAEGGGDHEPSRDDVNDVLTVLLPWLISILLHVGVVLLAVFVVWSTVEKTDKEEVIVPSSDLSKTPGAPLQTKQTKRKTQSKSKQSSQAQRSLAKSASQSKQSSLAKSAQAKSSSLIASAAGGGGGSAGKASPFGGGAASSAKFKSTFFGTGGNAKRIAYLIDASGSLTDTMPFVIVELKRSIGELSEKQKFTVIFFQGHDYIEVPPPGLAKATSSYKQKAIEWVDLETGNVIPEGTASPIPAIKRALRYNPQLLYMLSDNITGQGPYEVDQQQLISAIQRANDGTKINTIQFLYEDPLKKYGLPRTLELIADKTGGTFKFLDARELGVR